MNETVWRDVNRANWDERVKIHLAAESFDLVFVNWGAINWLHEHDSVPRRMFERLIKDDTGMYRWPDQPWLRLGFSLLAERPG